MLAVGCDPGESPDRGERLEQIAEQQPERGRATRVGAVVADARTLGRGLGPHAQASLDIHEPGATFIKLHLGELALAPGDQLLVHDRAGALVERVGASARAGWLNAVPGDRVRLTLETGSGARRGGVLVDRIGVGEVDFAAPRDRIEPAADDEFRSICGDPDMQPAACFDDEVKGPAKAIGRMLYVASEDGGLYVCTGSLVSAASHFLTNNHCLSSQAEVDSLEVLFDYQTSSCAGKDDDDYTLVSGGTLITTSPSLDYSLVQLPDDPAATYGWLKLDQGEVEAGEGIFIPQHPSGRRKEIAIDDSITGSPCSIQLANVNVFGVPPQATVGYYCDTEGGSSGSPVIRASDHRLIALHHSGGCYNLATKASKIWPEISSYVSGGGGAKAKPQAKPQGSWQFANLHAEVGAALVTEIVVPEGATKLEITTSGGSGDVDLYVRHGAPPTLQAWDHRPYLEGNAEAVVVDQPEPGTWHVMLHAFEAFAGVTLEIESQ